VVNVRNGVVLRKNRSGVAEHEIIPPAADGPLRFRQIVPAQETGAGLDGGRIEPGRRAHDTPWIPLRLQAESGTVNIPDLRGRQALIPLPESRPGGPLRGEEIAAEAGKRRLAPGAVEYGEYLSGRHQCPHILEK